MSFLKYMFDSDWRQRADIEDLRAQVEYRLTAPQASGASEKWVAEIEQDVKELAATVGVLMRKLAQAGSLDIAALQAEVAEELKPKRGVPKGPNVNVTCSKCSKKAMSHDMVKVGSEWMCRACARNP